MCNHLPTKPELDCIAGVVGPENKHKYVVATQDVELRKKLRLVPGVPLVYISRSIVLLETPSEKSLNKKKEVCGHSFLAALLLANSSRPEKKKMETIKLHAPASELALLSSSKHPVSKSLNSTTLIDSHLAPSASSSKLPPPSEAENATEDQAQKPKKKKKGPSGPNPLSVRKKKPTPASNEKVEKGKHNGKQSEKQAPEKRKRQRDDTDEVKSLSSRTSVRQSAAGAQGEGEVASGATTITEGPRKRKRRRTGKKVESGESTAAAALVAEA